VGADVASQELERPGSECRPLRRLDGRELPRDVGQEVGSLLQLDVKGPH
jgi:hypothetical protein